MNKEKTQKPMHHPHDGLFKTMFRTPEVARDFLQTRLKPDVFEALDMATFRLENSSFIDEKLKKSHSDLVFSIHHKKQDDICYLYFLIEHQTSYEKDMMMRVQEYNTKLMRQHINQGGKALPVIFNFILYTGAKSYIGPKSMLAAFNSPKLWYEAMEKEIVIDLAREDDNKIVQANKSALVQLLLKYEKKRDFCKLLDDRRVAFGELINKTPHTLTVFFYMLDRERHNPSVLLEKIDNLDRTKECIIMTGIQRLRNEGRTLGRKEGLKVGRERGKQETLEGLIKKGIITKEQAKKF